VPVSLGSVSADVPSLGAKGRRASAKSGNLAVDPTVVELPTSDPTEYVERNRAAWDAWARDSAAAGRRAWNDRELCWGIWDIPESELRLLEGLDSKADVIELGCGTASVSAWLARRGMRPVAVDISRAQLQTADRLQEEFGPSFPLVHANAEQVPFDDSSFDAAISEYGASLWCDPRRWLPEAQRLLRAQGLLIFMTNAAFLMACTPLDGTPAGERLVRDYFAGYRTEFPGEGGVEFHLTHSHWIRLLRANGFMVENLIEVRPPHGAKPRLEFASVEWARRWPSEEIWVARKIA
jgi:SAM-dependent methyltransferase